MIPLITAIAAIFSFLGHIAAIAVIVRLQSNNKIMHEAFDNICNMYTESRKLHTEATQKLSDELHEKAEIRRLLTMTLDASKKQEDSERVNQFLPGGKVN
jgi:transcriptional regulatory protein LevR